jgi:hypothetical protein
MMRSSRLSVLVSTVLLFASAHAAAPSLTGAIFTTDQTGKVTNGNTKYLSKCGATGVYLDGGPGPNAPAHAASLADGDYYFQVTDPSGKQLLSTDAVRDRCVSVAGGVFTGNCPTGTHETSTDEDHGYLGAHVVALCAAPEVPFLNTPSTGGEYKVWVTPVGDGTLAGGGFVGDPSIVDNDCSTLSGCFHGFRTSRSKTDNFKAPDTAPTTPTPTPTSCIRVEKQLAFAGTDVTFPGANWKIQVTDSAGGISTYFTDDQGSTGSQICGLAAGSYTVEEETQPPFIQVGVFLNGQSLSGPSVLVTFEPGNVTGDQTVLFINASSNDT